MRASFSIRTEIALKSPNDPPRLLRVLLIAALATRIASADEAPDSAVATREAAQAEEFGIFFGGMASQFDLCVRRGFLPKGDRSAEQTAATVIDTMRESNPGADQTRFVRQGWDFMKQQIARRASDYTPQKCAWVGKEWDKMLKTMRGT
jgi:hypothetical protein